MLVMGWRAMGILDEIGDLLLKSDEQDTADTACIWDSL